MTKEEQTDQWSKLCGRKIDEGYDHDGKGSFCMERR
jgi:hypothetical protein